MSKGLKIMTLDATDLLQYDTEAKQVVPSNLSAKYNFKEDRKSVV